MSATDPQKCIPEPPHHPGDLTDTCERCLYLNSYRFVPSHDPDAEDHPVFLEVSQACRELVEAFRADVPGVKVGEAVPLYSVGTDTPAYRLTVHAEVAPEGDAELRVRAEELSGMDGSVVETTERLV